MNKLLYEVFKSAFPSINVSYEDFISRLDLNDSIVLKHFDSVTGIMNGFFIK